MPSPGLATWTGLVLSSLDSDTRAGTMTARSAQGSSLWPHWLQRESTVHDIMYLLFVSGRLTADFLKFREQFAGGGLICDIREDDVAGDRDTGVISIGRLGG